VFILFYSVVGNTIGLDTTLKLANKTLISTLKRVSKMGNNSAKHTRFISKLVLTPECAYQFLITPGGSNEFPVLLIASASIQVWLFSSAINILLMQLIGAVGQLSGMGLWPVKRNSISYT